MDVTLCENNLCLNDLFHHLTCIAYLYNESLAWFNVVIVLGLRGVPCAILCP